MQAADLAISLRRRTPWEAMDLGLTMLQRWWRQVYLPHCLVAIPLMALAIATGWHFERAWVALLIVWWLKPLYDRVVLHVLSRAVFGELPSWRRVLAEPGQWLGAGLFVALVFRWWPNLTRSFTLPVRQLEGQAGRAARERRDVLGRRVSTYAITLTLVCLGIEVLVLWTSLGLLAQIFLPAKAAEGQSLAVLFGAGGDDTPFLTFEDVFTYAIAVLVLEPFYVAAGFALYLNRRTLLEGWDIEVALRRIAARHGAAVILTVIGIFTVTVPQSGYSEERKNPQQEIREVLSDKEFGYYREAKRWEYRVKPQAPEKGPDLSWLRAIGYAIARAGEVLLWGVAGALLAYAIWWASRMLPQLRAPPEVPYQPPAALFGMELAPEKLPADVGAAAAALAREGKLREALGLLYRGALSELIHKRGVRLLESHTEGDVLRLSGDLAYLRTLIEAWRLCAYALRMPPAAEVERLATEYKSVFA